MPWKAAAEAYLCFYSICPTQVFYRLEKNILCFCSREQKIKLVSNQFDEKCTAVFSSYLKSP